MDLTKVMDRLIELIELTESDRATALLPPSEYQRKTDQDHLLWMLDQINGEAVTGEKAHRWIGYIQGVLVSHKITTVEEMRDLNR